MKSENEIKELIKKEKSQNNPFANPNAEIVKKQSKVKQIEKEFTNLNG